MNKQILKNYQKATNKSINTQYRTIQKQSRTTENKIKNKKLNIETLKKTSKQ